MRIGFGSHQNTIDNYFGPSIVELSVLSVFFFLGGGGLAFGAKLSPTRADRQAKT